jgi:hypothetical protein
MVKLSSIKHVNKRQYPTKPENGKHFMQAETNN